MRGMQTSTSFLLFLSHGHSHPPTPEHIALLEKMEKIIGKGKAPPLTSIADAVVGDSFVGASAIAKQIADIFIMQLGGGLEIGWGEAIFFVILS